jgi:ribosomal protein S18 acetylase RimI-like enzyme
VGRTLLEEGPASLFLKIREYIRYNLDSKWHFVYLQFELEKEFSRIPMSETLTVRVASTADTARIRSELFPEMKGEQSNEKKYFDLLGQNSVRCFVAESEGRFVHYSWVFMDAQASPMVDVPFDRRNLRPGDVYIGPIFTVPGARGFIYPQVLSSIVRYLKECPGPTRIVLFVYGRNPAAVSFYKRLGFSEIDNSQPRTVWSLLRKKPIAKR